jgi:putative component of toxin-antitoxin plasmid stabilization module
MSKFVTKTIETVIGRQQFKQLVIVDDKFDAIKLQQQIDKNEVQIDGVLDIYESKLEAKYESSFRGIVAIMNRVANLQSLAQDKFRDITPDKETVKEYEIKFQDLRIYLIKITNGKLVLLCGFKNDQDSDFKSFRALKRQFLEKGGY